MALSTASPSPPLSFPLSFTSKPTLAINSRSYLKHKDANFSTSHRISTNLQPISATLDTALSLQSDVPFPRDYDQLLLQAKEATEMAFKDNRQLMEIEFPTAGLASVPGDGEGGIEMTGSMQMIREFCDLSILPEKTTRTRIVCSSDLS